MSTDRSSQANDSGREAQPEDQHNIEDSAAQVERHNDGEVEPDADEPDADEPD